MIDKSAAQNHAFKARVFLFLWVLLTGIAWFALDALLDQNLTKELYIFLQAWFASYSPVQLFGQKPFVQIGGHSYKAAELATEALNLENVQTMIKYFFIYTPLLAGAITTAIIYFTKRKKEAHQEGKNQINKWEGV